MSKKRKVLATLPNGDVKLVRKVKGKKGKFTTSLKAKANNKLTKKQAKKAVAWAEKKGFTDIRKTKSKYPWLFLDSDTKWPKPKLAKKLNTLAKKRKRYIFINEGWRTNARQWELWRAYQAGTGNLAAYPGTSNHEGGNAADVSLFLNGKSNWRVNVGEDSKTRALMKSLGLGLPVTGETWHTEISKTWRS